MQTGTTDHAEQSAEIAIHLVLQGKGGVGKTVVASWLAEFLAMRTKCVRCIDGDPVNRSLGQYKALEADKLDLVNDDGLIQRTRYDSLLAFDDGAKAFIQMPAEIQHREAPVLVVIGSDGKGEMTNYRVKEQTYIVDRLFDCADLLLGAGKKAQTWRSSVEDPKDKGGKHTEAAQREIPVDNFRIEAPSGMDLHPEPRRVVRLSKRTNMAVIGSAIALLLPFAYGGYRRTDHAKVAARRSSLPKNVVPATEASNEFTDFDSDGHCPA